MLGRRRRTAAQKAKYLEWVDAKQQTADHDDDDRAKPEPHAATQRKSAATGRARAVFDVFAFPHVTPTHGNLLSRGNGRVRKNLSKWGEQPECAMARSEFRDSTWRYSEGRARKRQSNQAAQCILSRLQRAIEERKAYVHPVIDRRVVVVEFFINMIDACLRQSL